MYTRYSLENLRNLVDPKDVLIIIAGVNPSLIYDSGDEVRCCCPLHDGNNGTAFSWQRSTGCWTCFTRGCGEGKSHDLYGFVSLMLNLPFDQAAEHVAKTFNYNLDVGTDSKPFTNANTALKDKVTRDKYKVEQLKSLTYLPGYCESGFSKVKEYLAYRGYDYEEVKGFNPYPSLKYGILRMGIPVYDDNNNLVGVNARLMDPILSYPEKVTGEDGKVYKVSKYKMSYFSKGSILYNLNRAKEYAKQDGLILVEGQLDVLRLWSYGIKNSVCVMGTTLTNQQVALLYKHCFKVTFLQEEGQAALVGVIKSIKKLKVGMKISIAELGKGDADSNSKEEILKALGSKKTLTQIDIDKICKLKVK